MEVIELEVGQKYMLTETYGVYADYQSESAMDSTYNTDRKSTEAHAYSTSSS